MKVYKTVEDVQDASDEEMGALQQRYIKKLKETDDKILDLTELGLGIYMLTDKKSIINIPEDYKNDSYFSEMSPDELVQYTSNVYDYYLYSSQENVGGQLKFAIERFLDTDDDYNVIEDINDNPISPSDCLGWLHPVYLKVLEKGFVEMNFPNECTPYVNLYKGIYRKFRNLKTLNTNFYKGYKEIDSDTIQSPFSSMHYIGEYKKVL